MRDQEETRSSQLETNDLMDINLVKGTEQQEHESSEGVIVIPSQEKEGEGTVASVRTLQESTGVLVYMSSKEERKEKRKTAEAKIKTFDDIKLPDNMAIPNLHAPGAKQDDV